MSRYLQSIKYGTYPSIIRELLRHPNALPKQNNLLNHLNIFRDIHVLNTSFGTVLDLVNSPNPNSP